MTERRARGKSIISTKSKYPFHYPKDWEKGLYYSTNVVSHAPSSLTIYCKRHSNVVEISLCHTFVILRILQIQPPTDLFFIYIKRSWKVRNIITLNNAHTEEIIERKSSVFTLRTLAWIYFLSVIFDYNLCICLFF